MLRKHVFEFHPQDLENDANVVEAMAKQCSNTEVRAVETERDVEAMKKAEFMERHVGNIYTGLISSVTKFGFFVRLENTIEGLVHVSNLDGYYEFNDERYALFKRGSNQSYRLGQKVKIRVLAASKANQTIDFIVV
jgi:ribonuclease R